jgi:hypothetical protein
VVVRDETRILPAGGEGEEARRSSGKGSELARRWRAIVEASV